jgi:hypothetical protein
MTKTSNVAEQAVRTYLNFLADPSTAVNTEAVEKAQAAYESESDPMKRLTLHAEMQRAKDVDGEAIEAAFVDHAKEYSDRVGISAVSYIEVHGVPRTVLRAAGFKVPREKRNTPRVDREQVVEAVPTTGTFTIRQVEEATGASNASVRNVFNELVDSGDLVSAGPDPDHEGKGKAPTLYKRAS